jgi:hypothetical protein
MSPDILEANQCLIESWIVSSNVAKLQALADPKTNVAMVIKFTNQCYNSNSGSSVPALLSTHDLYTFEPFRTLVRYRPFVAALHKLISEVPLWSSSSLVGFFNIFGRPKMYDVSSCLSITSLLEILA